MSQTDYILISLFIFNIFQDLIIQCIPKQFKTSHRLLLTLGGVMFLIMNHGESRVFHKYNHLNNKPSHFQTSALDLSLICLLCDRKQCPYQLLMKLKRKCVLQLIVMFDYIDKNQKP